MQLLSLTFGGVLLTIGGLVVFNYLLKRKLETLESEEDSPPKDPYRTNSPPENPQPANTAFTTSEFVIEPTSPKQVYYHCGHKGPKKFTLTILGKECTPKKVYFKDRPFCHACLRASIIRCVLCGNPIYPGSSIAAYGDMEDFKEEWKTYTTEEKHSVVGCMSMECCPSGGFFAGHWTGQEVNSPFAHGSAAAEAFATGKVVSGTIEHKK